jgi:hypothetical protein
MSDVAKNPLLPEPVFPKLEVPEPPNIPGVDPTNAQHPSCDGEAYKVIPSPDRIKVPAEGAVRIMIGVPILSYTHEFVESFMRFWTQICVHANRKFEVGYFFVYRKPVHMAEQQIVDVALYNKCTHVLFMDDDIYDVNIGMLQSLIDADKDVISGVMYASKFPHAMCCFRRFDPAKKVIDMPVDNSMYRLYEIPCNCTNCGLGLSHWDAKFCPVCGAPQDNLIQKVDLIPFCFTLVKMSVFDKLKKPYFHCTIDYPTDSWFADRCIEAGIQEWAHMGVRLNHAGCSDMTRPFMFQLGMEKAKATDTIVNISQEDMNKHEFLLHNKMHDAEEKLKPIIDFITPENKKEAEGTVVVPEPSVAGKGETNDSSGKSITDGVPEEAGTQVSG